MNNKQSFQTKASFNFQGRTKKESDTVVNVARKPNTIATNSFELPQGPSATSVERMMALIKKGADKDGNLVCYQMSETVKILK